MHVDWNWIKQRPHFLAEGLSSAYEVLVFYHYSSDRSVLIKNSTTIKHYPIPRLPFGRFKFIARANEVLQNIFFKVLVKTYNPNTIWITFPSLYKYIEECDMRNRTLVYDCMDDATEFNQDEDSKINIYVAEQSVLARADIVFSSSENLVSKLIGRGCNRRKIVLTRNAFDNRTMVEIDRYTSKKGPIQDVAFRICFVGSVGEHIDFDAILFCVHHLPSVQFHFIGPVVCNAPIHGNLFYHGPANHRELAGIVQRYDCTILPFKINDLILSVDPVKLYDYINYNKNIISVYYAEIERFEDYVFFYHDREELVNVVHKISGQKTMKYSPEARDKFLKLNSWSERMPSIVKLLEKDHVS